eukprot:1586083-Rhodomonas_salina.1
MMEFLKNKIAYRQREKVFPDSAGIADRAAIADRAGIERRQREPVQREHQGGSLEHAWQDTEMERKMNELKQPRRGTEVKSLGPSDMEKRVIALGE